MDYDKIHEELKKNISKMRDQIMSTKIKKFERDNKDYLHNRVYTWAAERGSQRRTWCRSKNRSGNPERSSFESYSTQSEGGKRTYKAKNKKQSEEDFLDADLAGTSSTEAIHTETRTLRYKKVPPSKDKTKPT